MAEKRTIRFVGIFDELFMRSWWVIFFILICYFCYEQGLAGRNKEFAKLDHQYLNLLNEKEKALALQENLRLQINSQSDPEWVELVLMKGLGLVPEGQIKVLFTDQKELLERMNH